eukprot:TRINITY_DN1677_c1_g2_i1.p1 TRINITY_DN1677_c1_g2~~TRINITY_DN1677_c1_g2_i1.p1  ORF type:complete len:111 (-),score=20.38 TRINITY_DN1677_c1_g2_i1:146-478(-)
MGWDGMGWVGLGWDGNWDGGGGGGGDGDGDRDRDGDGVEMGIVGVRHVQLSSGDSLLPVVGVELDLVGVEDNDLEDMKMFLDGDETVGDQLEESLGDEGVLVSAILLVLA